MDDFVLFTGFGLIFVNAITSGQFKEIFTLISDPSSTVDTKVLHNHLIQLGGELVLVLFLTFMAGRNKEVGKVVVALMFGLWMVWFMNNSSVVSGWVKNVVPQQVATNAPQEPQASPNPLSTQGPKNNPAGNVATRR